MIKLFLIIALIFHLVTVSCNSQITDKSDEGLTAYYIVKKPEKLTDSSYNSHQTIIIDTSKKIHKLDFGIFSTESTIEILRGDTGDEPIIRQHLDPNNRQIVDITGLTKGIYRIRFTAIAQSCVFQLEIK